MRVLSAVLVLPLVVSQLLPAAGKRPADTSASSENRYIATEYSVEIDYPNFVISILAHITGAHFSRLTLEEWDSSAVPGAFLYHLTESDDRWLDLSSDSTVPSFVKLPRSERVTVCPAALDFAKVLVRFFRAPRPDTVHAVFEYTGDTLRARAYQQYSRVDSLSNVTTVSRVETWNRDTGEGYIDGDVRAVTRDGNTTFEDIRINLINKNIKIHFTPIHTLIARGVEMGAVAATSAQNSLHRPD